MFASKTLPKLLPGHHANDGCVFPDPHFTPRQRNEPNPILVAVRASGADGPEVRDWHVAIFSTEIYGGLRAWEAEGHPLQVLTKATDEQLDHADRVLSRVLEARDDC